MSKLILGTVQFGLDYGINNNLGKPDYNSIEEIFNYAIKHGISTLDTADAYGTAIENISKYHKKYGNKFNVITKSRFENGTQALISSKIRKTLESMGISKIETFMFHSFDDFIRRPEILRELIEVKRKGLIQSIGVSIYNNNEFEYLIQTDTIDVIQIPYNVLDNSNKRGVLITQAKQKNKIIHVRSVFLQGLLFMQEEYIPNILNPVKNEILKIQKLALLNNLTMEEILMGYVNSNLEIDGIIIGVDSIQQLKTNIKAFQFVLSDDLVKEINNINIDKFELLNPTNWK